MNYTSYIEKSKLISEIETSVTTGDIEYDGTALEICEKNGNELFHIVVDKSGEQQFLFFATDHNYRISIELMERIICKAKQTVSKA